MRQIFVGSLFVASTLGVLPEASAGDDPRAVIERAIQVTGGAAALKQVQAEYMKMTGILYEVDKAPFTAEVYSQLDERYKAILVVDLQAEKVTMTQVLDRNQAWTRDDDGVKDVDPTTLADMKAGAYVDYLTALLPLLNAESYTLSPAGEIAVDGQPAVGIKVASKDRPEVLMYFDRATGFLVKTSCRHFDAKTNKDIVTEEVLRDYKEVNLMLPDEQTLKAAKIDTDDNSLLEYLRQRTMNEIRREKVQALIRQLGDALFEVREKAQADLVAQGSMAVALLTRAAADTDPEIATRAKECLQKIGKTADASVPSAVIRLLAQRHASGATEVLLAYLPSAPDETVVKEVQSALAIVGLQDGKPSPSLVKAATDPNSMRQAIAARVLAGDVKAAPEASGRRLFPRGLKRAMSGVQYKDGKMTIEWKLVDVQFFSRFEDKVFARP